MSNYCSNYLMIKGEKETLVKMDALLRSGEDGEFDFALIVPPPNGNQTENNWYIEHWGTNRQPEGPSMDINDEGVLSIEFGTAWAPSLPVSLELSKKFPEVFIQHTYMEEGSETFGFSIFYKGQDILTQDELPGEGEQKAKKIIAFIDDSSWILDNFDLAKLLKLRTNEGKDGEVLVIPSGIKVIKAKAFKKRRDLRSVVIPVGVTKIGDSAFEGCSHLTSVVIPQGVKSIGEKAFKGCTSLTSIVIPDGVKTVGWWSFEGCSRLTSVSIPNSVNEIGWWAFHNCSRLTSVSIPEGVDEIQCSVFAGCSSLTSVVIPDNVKKLWADAFEGCSSLRYVVIPEGVEKIGIEAFKGCSSLISVTIPESVKFIGKSAFSSCTSLSDVVFNSSPILEDVNFADWNLFKNCPNLNTLSFTKDVNPISLFMKYVEEKVLIKAPVGSKTIQFAEENGYRIEKI